jgi:hypothetical protein
MLQTPGLQAGRVLLELESLSGGGCPEDGPLAWSWTVGSLWCFQLAIWDISFIYGHLMYIYYTHMKYIYIK